MFTDSVLPFIRGRNSWDPRRTDKSIKRHSRNIAYKITKEQVKYAIKKLKENEQITLEELSKLVKKKYGKILLEEKQAKIENKTIIEWETELSKYNRKSLDIEHFKEYCKK